MQSTAAREGDKQNIIRTLYLCEEATWGNLLRWTQPRLSLSRLGEAISALLEARIVVIENRRLGGRKPVHIIKLREEHPEFAELDEG